jgi:PAS domain S-box-containing protein
MRFDLHFDAELPRHGVAALARWMAACAYLLPVIPVLYLKLWQDPTLQMENHRLHEIAILVATLEGLVISYVCWRCYLQSGERLVKLLTQGFLGFTVVYSMHGVFTPMAAHHTMLFLLYGPASRLLMSMLLLLAVRASNAGADPVQDRLRAGPWWRFLGALILINLLVAWLATSDIGPLPWLRMGMENAAAVFNLVAFVLIRRGDGGRPLLRYFSHALIWFAVSSLGFIWGELWNHLWWLAHGTFAVGFSILGFGVCKAYLNGHALSRVFGVDALFDDIEHHNAQLKEACQGLSETNADLLGQIHDLERSQQAFKTLFATVPDGILIVEMGGKILKANSVVERMLGYAPSTLLGVKVEMLMPSGYRELHVRKRERYEYMPQTRRMGTMQAPMPCLRSDGTLCYCDISIGGLVFQGEQCLVTFLRELQPPDAVEIRDDSALGEGARRALLTSVMGLVADMLLELRRSADGTYSCLSHSLACAQGLDMDAALGADPWMQLFFSRVLPIDLPQVIEALEAGAFEGSRLTLRWRHQIPGKPLQELQLESTASQGDQEGNLRWLCLVRPAEPTRP